MAQAAKKVLAVSLRYAAWRKKIWGIACPWGSLAPEALTSFTAMLCRRYKELEYRLPVGFARARSVRFSQGYALLTLRSSYQLLRKFYK